MSKLVEKWLSLTKNMYCIKNLFNKNPFTKTHHTGTSNFSHWKSYKRNSLIKVPVLSTTHTKQMHRWKKSTVHIVNTRKKYRRDFFSAVLISRKKVYTTLEWGVCVGGRYRVRSLSISSKWAYVSGSYIHGKIAQRKVNEHVDAVSAALMLWFWTGDRHPYK